MGPMKDEEKKPLRRSDTAPQQGETNRRTPREPHERDESADSQASAEPSQRRIGEIGRRDVERGVVDTTKGQALDEAYEKTRQGTPEPDKKYSP